jgi:hypothetical protein
MIQQANYALTPPRLDDANGRLLHWMLGAVIALFPVQIEVASDLRLAPSDFILAFAILLGLGVWRGVRPAWSIWHIGLLCLFFVYIYAKSYRTGTFTQFDLVNKLSGIVVLYSLFVCLTTLADSWENIRWYMKVFVLSVAVQNTVCGAAFLWCRHTGSQDPLLMWLISDGVDRLAGMLVDANAYGGMLAVAFAFLLLSGDSKDPLVPSWLWWACLLSLSMGLLLTSSRSAWLAVSAAMAVAIVRRPQLIPVVAVLFAAGIGAIAYTSSNDEFEAFVAISSRQNTIDERVEINHNAWEMFLENPLLGAGIGRFYEYYGIIVHNSPLWFLAEFGILGFCVYVGFLVSFLLRGLYAYRYGDSSQRPIVAGLIAGHLAMIGLSMGIEALYQRFWWLTMALLASSYAVTIRLPAKPSPPLMMEAAPPAKEQ